MNHDSSLKFFQRTSKSPSMTYLVFLTFVVTPLILQCGKNPAKSSIGEKYIASRTDLAVIDTFTVQLSTVILDSFSTAGSGRILVGMYNDELFGNVTSTSYFQIGVPDEFDVKTTDIYDSLQLVIKYDGYYCGDTSRVQCILVHQLTEDIEFKDTDINSSDVFFDYNPEPIGSRTFIPSPGNSVDTLAIRLSDEIGRDLFSRLRDKSQTVTSADYFRDYFHGLLLRSDEALTGSIIGFNASADDVTLRLFTSRAGESYSQIVYAFKLEDVNKQFNRVTHDFASTALNGLLKQQNELSSRQTGSVSFLKGGIGLVLRVDFPSLDELLLLRRGKIVEAQLYLSPTGHANGNSNLPAELVMYESNTLNKVLSGQGVVASSSLTVDELYNQDTFYTFNITDYLNAELADSYIDTGKGVIITLPSDALKTTFNQLSIAAKSKHTRLKLYYLSY
jgi:hypothetical protein